MAQMLNHEESRKPNNTQRRAPRRVEVTPNITVNSNPGNGSAFNPSIYPSATTTVATGTSLIFQAAGNSAVDFYVFLGTTQSTALFGGTQPYSAATAANNGTSLTVQSGAANQTFTLSLNSTITSDETDPQDGEIRVGT